MNVSSHTIRFGLHTVLPFLAFTVGAIALSLVFASERSWWFGVLPWALLGLFFLYLGILSRLARRSGDGWFARESGRDERGR